jgi:hypothetical protein
MHGDLARLRLLGDRDHDAQDAVLVAGRDVRAVDALAEREATQERPGGPLAGDPGHAVLRGSRSLGPDAQQPAVHVDVDGRGVDPRQVGVQHVAVGVTGEIHRHEPRTRVGVHCHRFLLRTIT